jgi:hypothetical protein
VQGLLEAVDRVAQRIPALERDFAILVDHVHRAYLRRALNPRDTTQQVSQDDLAALRRLALFLEAETTIDPTDDEQALQDGLYVAATVFEFLGQFLLAIEVDNEDSPVPSLSQTACHW